ncbi:hypothetical protein H6P81_003581 [Aristolochia fimbriata]|uniref:DUF7148 domain-containing protein n=1 Tax=Aristolochia fimbriata TaxID=158543 RepID=A0AAV7FDT2_ARIFI|nr:hypothetical protein H6P81_003581 [Aristolochia fimbriata]
MAAPSASSILPKQGFYRPRPSFSLPCSSFPSNSISPTILPVVSKTQLHYRAWKLFGVRIHKAATPQALPESDPIAGAEDDEDGISLGTMKLPADVDIGRFETLLFQWANSLCQGANVPLPVPLKVDRVKGGVRLGFTTVGDGKTEVLVYIDCVVEQATADSGPLFRALRKGTLKGQAPPGEERIMRSLLSALRKSVEIARI